MNLTRCFGVCAKSSYLAATIKGTKSAWRTSRCILLLLVIIVVSDIFIGCASARPARQDKIRRGHLNRRRRSGGNQLCNNIDLVIEKSNRIHGKMQKLERKYAESKIFEDTIEAITQRYGIPQAPDNKGPNRLKLRLRKIQKDLKTFKKYLAVSERLENISHADDGSVGGDIHHIIHGRTGSMTSLLSTVNEWLELEGITPDQSEPTVHHKFEREDYPLHLRHLVDYYLLNENMKYLNYVKDLAQDLKTKRLCQNS